MANGNESRHFLQRMRYLREKDQAAEERAAVYRAATSVRATGPTSRASVDADVAFGILEQNDFALLAELQAVRAELAALRDRLGGEAA